MLGSDVFENEDRIVIRLETPGLQREDLDVEVAARGKWRKALQ